MKKVPVNMTAELGPKEVLIKITHSGVCGTDVHYIPYGVALGHEGVGIVEKVGSEVTQLKVGDRAGGGYHQNSCRQCRYCLKGQDIWCYEREIYGTSNPDTGTFGDYFIGNETYLHKIPDGMLSEHAAPLQCAGATVYAALINNMKPGDRVGVIGIGGLGHLAIQFAVKLGAEVVVFSSTPTKEAEAKGFGASEYCLASEPEKVSSPVDVLLISGKGHPDWSKYLTRNVLARQGIVVPLTAPPSMMSLPAFPMFMEGYNIKSSLVASRADHDAMLRFAAHHGIAPVVEKFEMSELGIKKAFERLESGQMRYRGVLVSA